jgi:hypothetical protein
MEHTGNTQDMDKAEAVAPKTTFLTYEQKERFMPIKFQDGPINEVGVNGVQVDDVLFKCLEKLQGFNGNFPCTENTNAIQHLQETLFWLRQRRENRVARGVEGFNKL